MHGCMFFTLVVAYLPLTNINHSLLLMDNRAVSVCNYPRWCCSEYSGPCLEVGHCECFRSSVPRSGNAGSLTCLSTALAGLLKRFPQSVPIYTPQGPAHVKISPTRGVVVFERLVIPVGVIVLCFHVGFPPRGIVFNNFSYTYYPYTFPIW